MMRLLSLVLFGCVVAPGCNRCIRSDATRDQAVAVGHLRTVASMLDQYHPACGGFPETLRALVASTAPNGCHGSPPPSAEGLTGAVAADDEPQYGGYAFRYSPSDPANRNPVVYHRYELRADLESHVCKSCRSFWISDAGTLRAARGRPAHREDPVL